MLLIAWFCFSFHLAIYTQCGGRSTTSFLWLLTNPIICSQLCELFCGHGEHIPLWALAGVKSYVGVGKQPGAPASRRQNSRDTSIPAYRAWAVGNHEKNVIWLTPRIWPHSATVPALRHPCPPCHSDFSASALEDAQEYWNRCRRPFPAAFINADPCLVRILAIWHLKDESPSNICGCRVTAQCALHMLLPCSPW